MRRGSHGLIELDLVTRPHPLVMWQKTSCLLLIVLTCYACQNKSPLVEELSMSTIIRHLGIDTAGFFMDEDTISWDNESVAQLVLRPRDSSQFSQVTITKLHRNESCEGSTLRYEFLQQCTSLRNTSCDPRSSLSIDSTTVDGVNYHIGQCGQHTVAMACNDHTYVSVHAFRVPLRRGTATSNQD